MNNYIAFYFIFFQNNFIFIAILSLIVGFIALSRGRNLIAWIILSILITPIISLIALLIQSDLRKEKEEEIKHKEIMDKLNKNS